MTFIEWMNKYAIYSYLEWKNIQYIHTLNEWIYIHHIHTLNEWIYIFNVGMGRICFFLAGHQISGSFAGYTVEICCPDIRPMILFLYLKSCARFSVGTGPVLCCPPLPGNTLGTRGKFSKRKKIMVRGDEK